MANGEIRYRYHFSKNGISIFKGGFKSRKEAEEGYQKQELLNNPNLALNQSFVIFCDTFLDYEKDLVKYSTHQVYQKRFDRYIKKIGDIKLKNINFQVLHRWWSSLECSRSIKKRLLHDLKMLFEYIELFYGYRNIEYKKLVIPKDYSIKKIVKEIYILSISDFKRFYQQLESEYWRLLFLVSFVCGLRAGEVRALKPEAFDFSDASLQIFQAVVDIGEGHPVLTSPKSENSVRICYLPEWLAKRFQKYIQEERLKEDDYIFCSSRSKRIALGETSLNRKLHDVQSQAALPHFRFHSFRKSEVSLLNDLGLSGDMIRDYVGHDSFETTKRYYIGDSHEKKKQIRDILSDKMHDFQV